jgi:hypothetical protein
VSAKGEQHTYSPLEKPLHALRALAWNGVTNPPTLAHGLRNEVVPWCESAPQPQLGIPREKAVVDRGLPTPALRLGLVMQMTRDGRPQLISTDLRISRSSFDIRTSSHRFLCYIVKKEEKRRKRYG